MNDDDTSRISDWLYQACLVEVLSPKPGNVGPDGQFHDATVRDFVESARVSAPVIARAAELGIGESVLQAVTATKQRVGHNTNLGILLLLAPLAAAPRNRPLTDGIGEVLASLTVQDADLVYRAIRLAEPGGLGEADEQDVHESPTETLRDCMQLAADRDLIAAQYINSFDDVLGTGLEWLKASAEQCEEPERITWLALRLLTEFGDSLIARKCGSAASDDVRLRAGRVLDQGWPVSSVSRDAYRRLDAHLRSDGNRLNPGTTADMIAAIVFAGIRSGEYRISPDCLQQIQSWN